MNGVEDEDEWFYEMIYARKTKNTMTTVATAVALGDQLPTSPRNWANKRL